MYWAFPGDYAFQQLYRLLDTDEFATLARVVSRCVGGLMSGLYRRKHIELGVDGEQTPADLGEVLETEEERLPIRLTPMTATCRVPPLSRVKLGIVWSRGVARDAEQ